MNTKLYKINALFAQINKLPVFFVANALKETPKAVFLFGRGTRDTQKMGVCSCCGRTLTHPVSVLLGIGPECGQHWWDWGAVGGYTKENLERLKGLTVKIVVNQWIPNTCIKEVYDTLEVVVTPEDHPMLTPVVKTIDKASKLCNYIEYVKSGDPGIKIMFPYDPALILQVKTLHNRKYHGEEPIKFWSCELSIENIQKLISFGFLMDKKLISFLPDSNAPIVSDSVTIPGLKCNLFPYQKIGVSFLNSKNGCALIADEMGLGKTVQALAWLQMHPKKRPAVVVVPASLKLNWEREAKMWMEDPQVEIISGRKPHKLTGKIIIVNYDILPSWVPELKKMETKVLIMDEVHLVKNNAAKRTKAVKLLGKGIAHVIGLSGTPIVNRPVEAYNAIKLINPTCVGSYWDYVRRYCGAKHNGFGWDFSGATNTEELHKKLTDTIMLRRLKKDVLLDLPDKIYSFVPIELDNDKEYQFAEKNFIKYLVSTKGEQAAEKAANAQHLVEIEGLKQLAVKGKMNQCVEWISNFLDSDGKLVVFAIHKFVVDHLMNSFPGIVVKVDGSCSNEERQAAVDAFQNDPKIRLFVGNIQAAGVGITLTASSNVAFIELPWTPGALVQAEDRCHRIGQKDTVNIHYLLAADTIEEKIAKLLDKKRSVLDSVLDGKKSDEGSLFSELMKSYV